MTKMNGPTYIGVQQKLCQLGIYVQVILLQEKGLFLNWFEWYFKKTIENNGLKVTLLNKNPCCNKN